jgi:hypothetical protein
MVSNQHRGEAMAFLITVQMLLDVEEDAEAFDGVNEILRDQQRHFQEPGRNSCLIDYQIVGEPVEADAEINAAIVEDTYEEGMGFHPLAGT